MTERIERAWSNVSSLARSSDYCNESDHEDIELIGEIVEKEIPMKPIDIKKPVLTWGLCPVCKGEYRTIGGKPNRVFLSDKYCPDCGQKLDWSDFK